MVRAHPRVYRPDYSASEHETFSEETMWLKPKTGSLQVKAKVLDGLCQAKGCLHFRLMHVWHVSNPKSNPKGTVFVSLIECTGATSNRALPGLTKPQEANTQGSTSAFRVHSCSLSISVRGQVLLARPRPGHLAKAALLERCKSPECRT